jgi:GTP-binding protein
MFKMLISQTESSKFFGRLLIGKIESGEVKINDIIQAVNQEGEIVQAGKVLKIFKKFGVMEAEIDQAYVGDIVSIAGLSTATVGVTLNTSGQKSVIPSIAIDPPMISILVTFNDSPFQGKEADKSTINQIVTRLNQEADDDVSLRVEQLPNSKEIIEIFGRGDLHIGILLEKMRREGFEISAYPPRVFMKQSPEGIMEPIEKVTIECNPEHMLSIIDNLNNRKGLLSDSKQTSDKRELLNFTVPTRGLIGFRSQLISDTRGTAVIKSEFLQYELHRGDVKKSNKGAIISTQEGTTTAYSLRDVETKGRLWVGNNEKVYVGMVIGEHVLETDMEMNPCKPKKLTNIRQAGTEEQIKLSPKVNITLEEAIAQARDDELVEITPMNIRVRKRILDSNARKRAKKQGKDKLEF